MTLSLKREKLLFPHPIVIPKVKKHAFSAPASHHSTLTSQKPEKKHRFEDSYKEHLRREQARKALPEPNQLNRISKRSAENSLHLEEVLEETTGDRRLNVRLPDIKSRGARPNQPPTSGRRVSKERPLLPPVTFISFHSMKGILVTRRTTDVTSVTIFDGISGREFPRHIPERHTCGRSCGFGVWRSRTRVEAQFLQVE